MKKKMENKELLSRREFFRKAAKKALPFVATLTLPSFLMSCGGDDPLENGGGCEDCASACQGGCQGECSGSCEDSCKNTNTGSSSCSDCSAACKNDCAGSCSENCQNTCSQTCTGTSEGKTNGDISSLAIDLGLSVLWANFNVGASAPEEYGLYTGWADPTGNKTADNLNEYPSSNPPSEISATEYDIARVQWGDGWRLPTKDEFSELSKCTWEAETRNGIKGVKLTGNTGKSIFLPWGGFYYTGKAYYIQEEGHYWTGNLGGYTGNSHAYNYVVYGTYGRNVGNYRNARLLIRPVIDNSTGCKECSSGCVAGCKSTCSGSCKDGCQNGCTGGCSSGCTGGCQSGCTGGCKSGCTGNCTSLCAAACSNDCTGGCRNGCYGKCEGGCSNSCDNTCTGQCGGSSCGFNCSFQCGNTCQRTAF